MKTSLINSELLDAKIEESGLRISFIIEKLGISGTAFYKKKNGEIPFRAAEIYVLRDLLRLSDADVESIFTFQG